MKYRRDPVRRTRRAGAARVMLPLALILVVACGSPRRSEPIEGPLPALDPVTALGEEVFARSCGECHPGGEAGLAPSINEKLWPAFLIRFQIRNGVGAMPRFTRSDINDEELDALLSYLFVLRRHQGA